jgi:uncharacterized protein
MKKIAIIGTGISGLSAAYLLRHDYDITVYEKEARLGGHARTLSIDYNGTQIEVDTGFIVFNYRNYPHLTALFKALDVQVEKSDMSLGLSLEKSGFEWGCKNLNAVFGQRSNLLSLRFWRMLREIFIFNKHALRTAKQNPDLTLQELLAQLGMSDDFKHRFLLPTAGAIWSTSPEKILDFPAYTFAIFFDNHGLLTINDQPQWFTVSDGSQQYVEKVSAHFKDSIRLNTGVATVTRSDEGVHVTTIDGDTACYDEVVIASHSNQALAMLANPSADEQRILGAMRYHANTAYLHNDPSFMPKRKAVWSSWNYVCDNTHDTRPDITVTYWMNLLQNIPNTTPLFVTLNPPHAPKADCIFNKHVFEHPVYDMGMLSSQQQFNTIQGKDRIWYAGAYQRYGFHEDGIHSAVQIAKQLECTIPWE